MDDTDRRRRGALAQLGMLAGDRTEQVDLSDAPASLMHFDWALDGPCRSDIPDAAFPDSLAIIAA